jgi:predicted permease
LTIVAIAAMAFGISAGVVCFELRSQMVAPSLPLDDGDRIVGLRNWDAARVRAVPTTVFDYETFRQQLTLVESISAASTFRRNLLTIDGRSEPITAAAMTASAFRVARVPPLYGRALVEADEQPGASPVIVIGYEIWRERFAGEPRVVGQTVRFGNEPTTIVGVMPEGFLFPAAHSAWVPLRIDRTASTSAPGPALIVFGRRADGASTQQVQAQLDAIGLRVSADARDTRTNVRPEVVPFGWLYFDPESIRIGLDLGNVFVVVLLLLVSANVALLMFARSATRETEIAVRSALGAGRFRIVTQLFIEALLLAALAAVVGLATARFGLRALLATFNAERGQLPFWVSDRLTPETVIYAIALTVLSAAIIGVLPALRITGTGVQARLRESAAGSGGIQFGGTWTIVIAVQVAVTLMFPAAAFLFHRGAVNGQSFDVGFAADQYLSAKLELDRERAPGVPLDASDDDFRSRLRRAYTELERRVIAEPDVMGITFADRLPGTLHPRWPIELDGHVVSGDSDIRRGVVSASVAVNFFDVVGAPVLSGRNFSTADLESSQGVVIVNQSFVTRVLGGQNPIGRRVRARPDDMSLTPGPWLEIVGVVRDLGMVGGSGNLPGAPPGLYHPVSPDLAPELRLAIHTRSNPQSFAARLRALASAAEPTLQLDALMPLDAVGSELWLEYQLLSRLLTILSAIALLLSLTAIYSVMAFTVSRRTREIGIRLTLGADRWRVIAVILRRPLVQVSVGIVMGAILVALAYLLVNQSTPTAMEAALMVGYSILMMVVCLLACAVPTRRALAVQPASVLRADV